MSKVFRLLVGSLALVLAGCLTISPHPPELRQGNLFDSEEVRSLKIGMTQAEVLDILGSPLTQNFFQPKRWVYALYVRMQKKVKSFSVILEFDEHERLASVQSQGWNLYSKSDKRPDQVLEIEKEK